MGAVTGRVALMLTALAMVVGLAATAVAGPPGPVAAAHVKSGGTWTAEADNNGCQIQTFGPGRTFTSDGLGDAGTYTGGGKKITTTDTAGSDTGLVFSGTYARAMKQYSGTFNGRDSITATGQLVKGAVSSWDGYTC